MVSWENVYLGARKTVKVSGDGGSRVLNLTTHTNTTGKSKTVI